MSDKSLAPMSDKSLAPMSDTKADGKAALEEDTALSPRFDDKGLVTCVTVDDGDGAVLMVAYMNAEALKATLETGEVHYWSRSRGELWRKGLTSGQTQRLVEMRVDCDQDALLLRVDVGGDGGCCHTGRRSCFYRRVETGADGSRLALDAVRAAR